ncbi:hypothetical protein ACS0TY_023210 [Phlomoides rotata]
MRDGYIPKIDVLDTWRWKPSREGRYHTKEVYEWLVQQKDAGSVEEPEEYKVLWNNLCPPKLAIHAWRVIKERLPTTTNLHRRRSLPVGADLNCVFCRNSTETVRHVFFECPFAYSVWMGCLSWIGVATALPSNPTMSLLYFSRLFRGKKGKVVAGCIWECIVGFIWKGRNAIIFRNEVVETKKMVEEIITRTWSWIVYREHTGRMGSFVDWRRNPREVMGN